MSQLRIEKFVCPLCHGEGQYGVWESVNVDLGPLIRERIMNDEMFVYRCPHCGAEMLLPYGFLDHETTHKYMLSFDCSDPELLYRIAIYEEQRAREAAAAQLKADKMSNVFALNLVRDFILEQLGGDVERLRDFRISDLRDDEKYGNGDKLLQSILTLVFADAWPGLCVYAVESYDFECSRINSSQNLLGSNIGDEYFITLNERAPREGQHEAALSAYKKCETIGNFIIWPSKARTFGEVLRGYDVRGFMDQFLMRLYDVLTDKPKVNFDLKSAVYKNRRYMDAYKGEEGFRRFVSNMMLEDYVGEDLLPVQLFDFVWASKKGLAHEEYLAAVDKNCALWERLSAARSERIIDKLKVILKEN